MFALSQNAIQQQGLPTDTTAQYPQLSIIEYVPDEFGNVTEQLSQDVLIAIQGNLQTRVSQYDNHQVFAAHYANELVALKNADDIEPLKPLILALEAQIQLHLDAPIKAAMMQGAKQALAEGVVGQAGQEPAPPMPPEAMGEQQQNAGLEYAK